MTIPNENFNEENNITEKKILDEIDKTSSKAKKIIFITNSVTIIVTIITTIILLSLIARVNDLKSQVNNLENRKNSLTTEVKNLELEKNKTISEKERAVNDKVIAINELEKVQKELKLIKGVEPNCKLIVDDPTGTPLNVRDKPNGTILGNLQNRTELVIISESNGWLKIEKPIKGWIFGDYTKLICQTN